MNRVGVSILHELANILSALSARHFAVPSRRGACVDLDADPRR